MSRALVQRFWQASFWEGLEDRVSYRIGWRLKGGVIVADVASFRVFNGRRAADGEEVQLRLRPLGGQPVVVRAGTTDLYAVTDTLLGAHHLPPPGLVSAAHVREIWDLGANIGISMAHFAQTFRRASVVGVELDARNLALCRRNVGPYGGRCEVIHAGVWPDDGRIAYDDSGDQLGFQIERNPERAARGVSVRALSLNTLLAERGGGAVDYLKMDIEGAEREVLRMHTEWAAHVSLIVVEVHEPYTVAECLDDLRRLGFRAWQHPRYRGRSGKPPVFGSRLPPDC